MSKARAKGTGWETEWLPQLQILFGPQVDRAPLKGIQDKGDFVGVPWLHEAKNTIRPNFLEWARTATKKAGNAWVIGWHGDRRKPGNGPYILMPIELYEQLVQLATDNWDYVDRDHVIQGRMAILRGDTK